MERLKKFIERNSYVFAALVTFAVSVLFAIIVLITVSVGSGVDQTSVGFIYIGDKSRNEYTSQIASEVTRWKTTTDYRLRFQGYEYDIDFSLFDYDQDTTLSLIRRNRRNEAYFTLTEANRAVLEMELRGVFGDYFIDHMNVDQFLFDLSSDMQKLYSLKYYNLFNYLHPSLRENVIAEFTLANLNESDINALVSAMPSFSIPANTRFSLLNTFANKGLNNNQISIVASGLSEVIQETSITGISKIQHFSADTPAYVSIGSNAMVRINNRYDFNFFNNEDYAMTVLLEKNSNTSLTIKLVGYAFITEFNVRQVHNLTPFEVDVSWDETLNENTPGVVITVTENFTRYYIVDVPGQNGLQVDFLRDIFKPGEPVETIKIFTEFYTRSAEKARINEVPHEVEEPTEG